MRPAALAWTSAALCALGLLGACSDRPSPKPPTPETPTPDPAPDVGVATCAGDRDCTDGWHPQMPSCGPVARCFAERCVTPPAMSGEANAETGQIAFETAEGERRYHIELVDDRFEITRGLMCRRSMRPDWGMLFVMERTKVQSFWMLNTLIPLDMVFIDEGWTVVGVVEQAEPRTTTARTVGVPSRYVLELVGGAARRAGITRGTQARFYAPRAAR